MPADIFDDPEGVSRYLAEETEADRAAFRRLAGPSLKAAVDALKNDESRPVTR